MTMSSCEETIVIGLGEMQVMKGQPVALSCVGVGSCIALCAYDPVSKVGGMAHLVLPNGGDGSRPGASAKYVDTGVPLLFEQMRKQGALGSRLAVKLAGGARMLAIPGMDGRLDIGARNITATEAALDKEGFSASAAELGGNCGRTVQLFVESGKVTVKTVGGKVVEL